MRKWVMWFHIHTGLLFFGFLLIFGLSSLVFNHNPKFLEREKTSPKWDQPISTVPQADLWKYAAAVADDMGLDGRVLHPVSKNGALDFDLVRPGRRYIVHLKDKGVHVDEFREGFVATLSEMHGVRPTNNSPLLNLWAWYAIIGSVVLVGSAITGVYVWAVRPRERILGWTTLAGATAVSLGICFYIWAKGISIMYHFMRRTHLFAALVLFIFVLLYSVSGYLLEFPLSPLLTASQTLVRVEPFQYAGDMDSPRLAEYVKSTYDLHGKLGKAEFDKKTGTRHFVFVGIKGYFDARISKDVKQVTLAIRPNSFLWALIRMHHLAGFEGGAIYETWGVMLDLVAVALVLFALSGIYLWYKLTKRRALGWIMLAISIAYTAATGIWCVYAR